MNLPYQLILASNSPRRKELLQSLELDFAVEVYATDESFPADLETEKVAEFIAQKKAEAFRPLHESELLITSDTVVINDGQILGKPSDKLEAIEMLTNLSGKQHQVTTAVCLKTLQKEISFSVTTEVYFSELDEATIEHYVDQYKPFDKAGAYGIQEWIGKVGISKIEGDYYNVVGLPLFELNRTLLTEFSQ